MELPNPLLTFDLYDDFVRTSEIKDEKERIQSLYAIITKLPTAHYDMFERLIFHLARSVVINRFTQMQLCFFAID